MAGCRGNCEVLGGPRDADAEAIRSAFRTLAADITRASAPNADAEQRFREIAEAYGGAVDPARRASYARKARIGKRPAGRSPFAGIVRIRYWGSPFSVLAVRLLSLPVATRSPGLIAVQLPLSPRRHHQYAQQGRC
jgi:hypothetical protein